MLSLIEAINTLKQCPVDDNLSNLIIGLEKLNKEEALTELEVNTMRSSLNTILFMAEKEENENVADAAHHALVYLTSHYPLNDTMKGSGELKDPLLPIMPIKEGGAISSASGYVYNVTDFLTLRGGVVFNRKDHRGRFFTPRDQETLKEQYNFLIGKP